MAFESGPYVISAALCRDFIEDSEGSCSLIRIINGLTHRASAPEMPPVKADFKAVVMLAPGRLRGRHEVRVVPQLPSGETWAPMIFPVHFQGESGAPAIRADVAFTFTMEGLYWFVVYFDGVPLTRIPFDVKYLPVPDLAER